MRNPLIGLVPVLMVVASVTAQEQTRAERKEDGRAQPTDQQRKMADLRQQLADLEDKAAAIQQAKNEQNAEYKVKVATLEAENKIKITNLDRDSQRTMTMAEHVNRELARLATEARNPQARDGAPSAERRGSGEPRSRRPVQPPDQGDASTKPAAEQMLDKVMKKLEEMDQRLMQVEARTRNSSRQ
jgi:hypothetical protein